MYVLAGSSTVWRINLVRFKVMIFMIGPNFHFVKCSPLNRTRLILNEITQILNAKSLILNEIAKFLSTKLSCYTVCVLKVYMHTPWIFMNITCKVSSSSSGLIPGCPKLSLGHTSLSIQGGEQ